MSGAPRERRAQLKTTTPAQRVALRAAFADDVAKLEVDIAAAAGRSKGPNGLPEPEETQRDAMAEAGPLWDAFYSRFGSAPRRPRTLSEEALLGCVGELAQAWG